MSDFYEKNHQNYFASTFKINSDNFLSPLAKRLKAGDSILDIGCGSGRDLLWGIQQGYEAVGFEQSPSLANLARIHSRCTVIEGDFTSYDFSKLRFTALVFVGSLVHLSKEELPIILKSTRRALVSEGLIFITMKEGNGFSQADDGRVFTLWSRKDLERIFADQNLQILDFLRQTSKIRSDDVWLGYVLRNKNAIKFAIELNGEQFHHPVAIGTKRYRSQLFKQNSLVSDGFKVFRWSLNGMKDRERFILQLSCFMGWSRPFRDKPIIKVSRPVETFDFSLYTHQTDALKQIADARRNGKSTFLLVLLD